MGFRDSDRSVIRVIEMVSEKRAREAREARESERELHTSAGIKAAGRERGKEAELARHRLTGLPMNISLSLSLSLSLSHIPLSFP